MAKHEKKARMSPEAEFAEAVRTGFGVETIMHGSEAAAAKALGVPQSVVNRLKNGKTISMENLAALCARSSSVRNHLLDHLMGLNGEKVDVWESLGRDLGRVLSVEAAYRLVTILREQKDAGAIDEEFAVLRAAGSHVRSALAARSTAEQERSDSELGPDPGRF